MPTTMRELARPVPAPCPDTLGRCLLELALRSLHLVPFAYEAGTYFLSEPLLSQAPQTQDALSKRLEHHPPRRSASTPSLGATVTPAVEERPVTRAAVAATRARTPKPARARDPMTTSTAAL